MEKVREAMNQTEGRPKFRPAPIIQEGNLLGTCRCPNCNIAMCQMVEGGGFYLHQERRQYIVAEINSICCEKCGTVFKPKHSQMR